MARIIERVFYTSSGRAVDWGLLWLRVAVGSLMLVGHGWDKLLNYETMSASFPDPLGVGSNVSLLLTIFAEVFCSIALILGVATRFASLVLLVQMAVVVIAVHAVDPWRAKELPVLFAINYMALLITGAGKFSLDAIISPKREVLMTTTTTTTTTERETADVLVRT